MFKDHPLSQILVRRLVSQVFQRVRYTPPCQWLHGKSCNGFVADGGNMFNHMVNP